MKRRRYTPEQKAEALRRYRLGRENTRPRICRDLNISERTLKWWAQVERSNRSAG